MFTADRLMAHSRYLPVLQDHLTRTMGQYSELQQVLRFLDSQEKWLLAFLIYRQWVESLEKGGTRQVYMSGIWEEAKTLGGYSRNTVSAFVEGLVAYGFIRRVPREDDRRYQELHLADYVHRAFRFWYLNHAITLDQLDGGSRADRLAADPELVLKLHPPLVTNLVRQNIWLGVPEDLEVFFRMKNGYLVLDYLMGLLQVTDGEPAGYRVGVISRSELTRLFQIGRSTIYRLFVAMEEQGLAWAVETASGPELWMSRPFILTVCRWQAAKFAIIDEAFASLQTA